MSALRTLAEAVGVAPRWQNYRHEWQEVSEDSLRAILTALGFPAESETDVAQSRAQLADGRASLPPLITATLNTPTRLPIEPGPFELTLEDGTRRSGTLEASTGGATLPAVEIIGYHLLETAGHRVTLAVAPEQGQTIPETARPWAFTVQLYGLRRKGDGGLGDFEALRQLMAPAKRHGADGVAISPVHAQFSADPDRFSPYSPSSRINLNVLHAAIDMAPGPENDALERADLVDWSTVSRRRLAALRAEFDSLSADRQSALAAFRAGAGDATETHARFEALHAVQFGQHGRWHWRTWPEGLRHPGNPDVAAFAREHANEVTFHAFMQWRADEGLRGAQQAARDAGMSIGLIADLAVGADSGGSHGWARQDQILGSVNIGAPPDLLNGRGQNWGLAAFSPTGLRQHGYSAFLEMLRAAMRHAGGVRIDHALGLRRLWVIPEGCESKHGAYLAFPQSDLMRLIALESARHRAIVVGEDLGTIPPGFQDEMALSGVLGMRVLWFERDLRSFWQPRGWSPAAAAMTSTHDLPTLAGWWRGRDLEWRAKLNLSGGPEQEAEDGHDRFRDRFMLWEAMQASGTVQGPPPPDEEPAAFVDAATRYVAGAACDLMLLPIEDALGLEEQPNLPGTMSDQHPNWQRRLPTDTSQLLEAPAVAARLAAVGEARRA
ncbi:MAG: 4-alpha-glucanotransferase [Acetobacteraceae bacterium]|nr:4-alpha-glucanotransferase [Acetobacteraceae bacterium]